MKPLILVSLLSLSACATLEPPQIGPPMHVAVGDAPNPLLPGRPPTLTVFDTGMIRDIRRAQSGDSLALRGQAKVALWTGVALGAIVVYRATEDDATQASTCKPPYSVVKCYD